MTGTRIVLTADRTLMSEYGGTIFLGFFASAPRELFPAENWLYGHFLCPPMHVSRPNGEPLRAPVGLRKIEAGLLTYGFGRGEIAITDPDCLDRAIGGDTKVIGVTTMDPRGLGLVISTYTPLLGGKEAYKSHAFRDLMNKKVPQHNRP